MNDDERKMWIENDEGLYDWWKSTHKSLTEFVRENRADIDAAIKPVLDGEKRSHYLKYD